MRRRFSYPTILLVLLLTQLTPLRAGVSQAQRPDEHLITTYLNAHPLITDSGAKVLDVTIQGEALVIDLSAEVLPEGAYDQNIFTQLQADLDQALSINLFYMTTFKVAGQPLEYWGRPAADFDIRSDLSESETLPISGPLAGVKIALSPGHGLYWNETYASWLYQRLEFFGIREDTLNAEIMRYVQAALVNQGATVIQLRELDFNARTGVTGSPAWHESARQYAIAEGLPSSIYDGSNTNYNSDIRVRPYMANYFGADLLISLHNNGWDGTLRGTESYWDINKHPESQAFANAIHSRIINTIREEYDPDWIDRRVRSTDWSYGELYFADMPAVLLELAFMDNPIDNSYLHDETFKLLAAKAITQGVCDYWGVTCEEFTITPPLVLETPTLAPLYKDGMCGSGWYRFANQRNQPAYLALNTSNKDQSSHKAVWQQNLPLSGEYMVEAFIPGHSAINWLCPEKTISWDTGNAVYQITHANGTSEMHVNQAPISNDWVALGVFYFYDDTQAKVTLSDITGEQFQTTSVSASALRFTLVNHTENPVINSPWVNATWLESGVNTPASSIAEFFAVHNSCLQNPIIDTDGIEVDMAAIIQGATSTHQINPLVLLALMESEQNALSQCPNQTALASLMGLDPPSTARDQITRAADVLASALSILKETGMTPNGWKTGSYQLTLDGVGVVPANDTITTLFDHNPNAGVLWGGSVPDEKGIQGIYAAVQDYNLNRPLQFGWINFYLPLIQH